MNTDFALQTTHLKKHFGSVKAVEDISLSVKRGEAFGFLGANGAGKTTTMSMILGLTHPTFGRVEIFGEQVTPQHHHVLQRVGAMIGSPPALIPFFSAHEHMRLQSLLRPDLPPSRIVAILDQVGLQPRDQHRKVGAFSSGMKQRLALALALVNAPDLLILDEPTNGMDPAGMHEMRTLLRTLVDRGMTIFISSHLLREMEQLCDRFAIIKRGCLLAQGTTEDLLKQKPVVRIKTSYLQQTTLTLRMLVGSDRLQVGNGHIDVQGLSSEEVMIHLVEQKIVPQEVSIVRPDLESIFLAVTGDRSVFPGGSHQQREAVSH